MFKNKTIKLFLILGVIFFSLVGVVGCSNPTGSDNVNATYIRTHFEDDEGNGEFKVVNNHIDLVSLLEDDAPEKYNDNFFETKSLLVFKIVESSGGNKSEIESYEIIDKTLNVYVKTKLYGDTCDMGYWWFILELSNEEVETFENVNIFKNGEEIVSGEKQNISNNLNYYTSYSFCNIINWPFFIGEEYNLAFGERRYHFVLSFQDLDDIFYTSTGINTLNYFSDSLFEENIVLCIVRDETGGTADVKYYDFEVNGLELSIEEKLVGGGAEVVSRYLDFVIIPKSEIPNGELNLGLEYYWD